MSFSKKVFFLPLIFLTVLYSAFSQSPLTGYSFQLKYHYAFVMNHSYNMAHLANQRPWGVEADVLRQTTGSKKWEQHHNYPIVGYSFLYVHMDPQKNLGDSYSFILYYSKKFLQHKSTFFSYRFGLGGAYIERRFDRESNYQNNLISSRLNYALNGRISFTWNFASNWSFNTGIGLMHYSNGAMKVPNLGINLPSLHAGISFTPAPATQFIKDSSGIFKRKTQCNLALLGGMKQVYPVGGHSYFSSTLSFYVNRVLSHKSALNLGTELFYDVSNKTVIDTLSGNRPDSYYFKWGIVAGHEFIIDRLSLLTQFGVYLFDPLHLEKPVYQRFGLKYGLNRKVFLGMSLKTHFGQADFVEWGVGYRF